MKSKATTLLVGMLAVVASTCIMGSRAAAQSCGQYVNCTDYWHQIRFSSTSPELNTYLPRHDDCKVCMFEDEPVDFEMCHSDCETDPGPWDPYDGVLTAISAAERRDVSALMRLALVAPSNVVYNASRGRLQVIGCDGALVASLALHPSARADNAVGTTRKYGEWVASVLAFIRIPTRR